jgi:hypothetical protein
VEVTGRKKGYDQIDIQPSTIQSWFRPLNIEKTFNTEKQAIKNPKFGSGITNALWSDDEISTLNNIKGIPIECGDRKIFSILPQKLHFFITRRIQSSWKQLFNQVILIFFRKMNLDR